DSLPITEQSQSLRPLHKFPVRIEGKGVDGALGIGDPNSGSIQLHTLPLPLFKKAHKMDNGDGSAALLHHHRPVVNKNIPRLGR
ncbi:MAG: hypothetical protein KAG97_13530, partial [Victivallales bacterium]|nr:hypothetical protein [Victivallales bacterium]